MKFLIAAVLCLMFVGSAMANEYRPFETTTDASDRTTSEHYAERQAHGGNEPLGGYSEKLGN